MKRKVYSMYKCNMVDMLETANGLILPLEKAVKINSLENRTFRMFGKQEIIEKSINNEISINVTCYNAENFIVVNFDYQDDFGGLKEKIINKGFMFKDKLYRIATQSSSQNRTAKACATSEDPETVRKEITYDAQFPKVGNISKMEGRHGQSMSSTIAVGCDFTYDIIDDPINKWEGEVRTIENKFIPKHMQLNLTPCDGQGTITPMAAAKVAYRLELLSDADWNYFNINFESIAKVRDDKRLVKIFSKIPSAIQIRFAGDKGLLVVFEHNKFGYTKDIVFTKSMVKYDPSKEYFGKIPLEVANWSKKQRKLASLNYQFIQALDIQPQDLIELAKVILRKIDNGILVDQNKALEFLGLVTNLDGDDVLPASKLMHALQANPNILPDVKIQNDLRKLCNKLIYSMRFGKIPVQGNFHYVITDPYYMFEQNILNKGEICFNNREEEFGLFRSPLIHRSEALKSKGVSKDEFWYLNNIIIINPFEDILPRMGGANQ